MCKNVEKREQKEFTNESLSIDLTYWTDRRRL